MSLFVIDMLNNNSISTQSCQSDQRSYWLLAEAYASVISNNNS